MNPLRVLKWIQNAKRERERVQLSVHDNYESIISMENLLVSWRDFLRGKRKRKDVAEFGLHLFENIHSLHNDLITRTYQHSNYIAFKINDPKPRDIHKASVCDRLLHHAIYRILYPLFDKKFIHHSYSSRKSKGTHRALIAFKKMCNRVSKNNTKTVWILKCDISKFFASIDHDILKSVLIKHIRDFDTFNLLDHLIKSFQTQPNKGLPLGNLTSQLLVNVYMNEFDQWAKHTLKAKHYIRYADDFVILHTDKLVLENYLKDIKIFLHAKLKLQLHPKKVSITTLASGVDFLGWVHFPYHCVLRTVTKRRMFKNIKKREYAEESVQSYLGMLKHGNTYHLRSKILNNKKITFLGTVIIAFSTRSFLFF